MISYSWNNAQHIHPRKYAHGQWTLVVPQRGVGVFLRVLMPTSLAVSLAQLCMYTVILRCLSCHALTYANGVCLHLLVPPFAQYSFFATTPFKKEGGGEGWLTSRVGQVESLWEKELIYFQMTKLEVATAFYKNCASYRPFEHINRSITFEPSYFLLFHLGQ